MRKSDTFKGYRDDLVKSRIDLIRISLSALSSSTKKRKFDNVTDLAKTVASMVYQKELELYIQRKEEDKGYDKQQPAGMSYTTLLRNKEYRPLLDMHLAEAGHLSLIDVENNISSIGEKALISQKNVEILNLQNQVSLLESELRNQSNILTENERLKKFVESHYTKSTPVLEQKQIQTQKSNEDESKIEAGYLFKLIVQIIEQSEYLEIDHEGQAIRDLTKLRQNQVIVQGKPLETFFKYLNTLEINKTKDTKN
ncbi:hypothetical protein [Vibrio diazotrophicus]|uniref:hypothetical protein n=1 Tax=Vibrio diazotrophicus TaxID=685 RepID=UPI000C9E8C7E|nr:hypothetical protein [Vibrio diazotrophicus]PNH94236.1 hypothetical protein C1O24_18190 [Vibrio diazotrophicus]